MDDFFLNRHSPDEVTRTADDRRETMTADGHKVVNAEASHAISWDLAGELPTSPSGEATVSPTALTLRAETVMKAETF